MPTKEPVLLLINLTYEPVLLLILARERSKGKNPETEETETWLPHQLTESKRIRILSVDQLPSYAKSKAFGCLSVKLEHLIQTLDFLKRHNIIVFSARQLKR